MALFLTSSPISYKWEVAREQGFSMCAHVSTGGWGREGKEGSDGFPPQQRTETQTSYLCRRPEHGGEEHRCDGFLRALKRRDLCLVAAPGDCE